MKTYFSLKNTGVGSLRVPTSPTGVSLHASVSLTQKLCRSGTSGTMIRYFIHLLQPSTQSSDMRMQILTRPSFQNAVLLLVQDLADPNGPSAGSDVYAHIFPSTLVGIAHMHRSTKNLDSINSALSVVTPISGPLAPVVASVGLSVMFAKWLSDMYASTYVPPL